MLTNEFNPGSSDVDSIAIVQNEVPLELEEKMMNHVRTTYPGLEDFYIRFIYLGELNGEKARAPLASVIYPKILLLEMPNWRHIIGQEFTNQDFESIETKLEQVEAELKQMQSTRNECELVERDIHDFLTYPRTIMEHPAIILLKHREIAQ